MQGGLWKMVSGMRSMAVVLCLAFVWSGITPLQAAESRLWLKLTLLGADAALAGFAVYTIKEQRQAATSYNELYLELNNTTVENYRILREEADTLERKGIIAAGAVGLAATFVAYTLADLLWVHQVFPKNARVEYDGRMFALSFSREI